MAPSTELCCAAIASMKATVARTSGSELGLRPWSVPAGSAERRSAVRARPKWTVTVTVTLGGGGAARGRRVRFDSQVGRQLMAEAQSGPLAHAKA